MAPPRWFRSLTDASPFRRNADPSAGPAANADGARASCTASRLQPRGEHGEVARRRRIGEPTLPIELIGQVAAHLRHVEPSAASQLGPSPRLWPGPDFATLGALRLCSRALDAEVRTQVPDYGDYLVSMSVQGVGGKVFRALEQRNFNDDFGELPQHVLTELPYRRSLVLDYGRADLPLSDTRGWPQAYAFTRLTDAIEAMPELDHLAVRNCIRRARGRPASGIVAAVGNKPVRVLDLSVRNLDPEGEVSIWPNVLNFTGLDRLEHLRLRGVDDAQPEALAQLRSLRSLSLENNLASHWLEGICRLPALESLNLRSSQLFWLPAELFHLRALRVLLLSDNHLQVLPPAIGELTQLSILRVNDNALTFLPEQLGSCRRLEHLDLGDNDIAALPDSFAQLTALRTVVLRANGLTTLPASLASWRRLETLDAADNHLEGWSWPLLELPALRAVRLQGNPLKRRARLALWRAKREGRLEQSS